LNGSDLPLLRRGKVRDVYALGDKLLIVATDRISAFDWVLGTPVPGKGELLSAISEFWFTKTGDIAPNHFITRSAEEIKKFGVKLSPWQQSRAMLVKKANRIDYECVVRGWLSGSGWAEYKKSGSVCGEKLPPGLKESDKLPTPIFTPAAKAMAEKLGFKMGRANLDEFAATLDDLARTSPNLVAGTGSFTFTANGANGGAIAAVSAARRARLHLLVARSLEDLCGDEPGDRAAELARH